MSFYVCLKVRRDALLVLHWVDSEERKLGDLLMAHGGVNEAVSDQVKDFIKRALDDGRCFLTLVTSPTSDLTSPSWLIFLLLLHQQGSDQK